MRILALPFYALLSFVALFSTWLKLCFAFLRYGGEVIAYRKNTRKTILDIYEKLKEIDNDDNL